MKYILEIWEGRALTAISINSIHFNIAGHMTFDNMEGVKRFLEKNKNHFFGLHTLQVVEAKQKD